MAKNEITSSMILAMIIALLENVRKDLKNIDLIKLNKKLI
jgi:hypothetical protein